MSVPMAAPTRRSSSGSKVAAMPSEAGWIVAP
jgi:hypothetical protein